MTPSPTITIDVHLEPQDLARALRDDVRAGLTASPKALPPKWFYDDRGSRLFDEITRLPEYYPTRCEREILEARAADIASLTKADTLVELGSGTSEKTRLLLDALAPALDRFIPFDVSEGVLLGSATDINTEYPGLAVHAVVGDFEHHLPDIPDGGNRLVAFLGGTIGNFPPAERSGFLSTLAATLHAGDHVLIGFDLVKDVDRLEAAYNDSAGVTAAFNRNVLRVLNRELGATFDVDGFEHVAFFDTTNEWIEMRLRATAAHRVEIGALDLDVGFEAGEELRTEISAKFRHHTIEAGFARAGLEVEAVWTDHADEFALALGRPA